MGVKAFGQLETWNMDILHTEGTLARFAVEMNMPVVMIASPFFFAEFVAEYASPIFEGMYHIMFQKEGKGTEDARLVHRNHRSEEHTSELQSRFDLVCRLLLEKKKKQEKTMKYNIPKMKKHKIYSEYKTAD